MEPLIRLFHISDLHFCQYAQMAPGSRPNWQLKLQRTAIGRWVLENQGTEGHEPSAVHALEQSIAKCAQIDSDEWQDKTILVSTGDFSTWGDLPSIEEADKWVETLGRIPGIKAVIKLYGNHDVWPGAPHHFDGLPIGAKEATLRTHRDALRNRVFTSTWMEDNSLVLHGSSASVALLSINTVLHEPIRNMFALGNVSEDLYWRHPSKLDDQKEQLANTLGGHDIALVFSHHPIHDPPAMRIGKASFPPPWWLFGTRPKALINARKVATRLTQNTASSQRPIRLVLSGHSHAPFPPVGKLPDGSPPLAHAPLVDNCVQLTVGTATQASLQRRRTKRRQAQTWQILNLRFDAAKSKLEVERIVLARRGSGPFNPLCPPHDPSRVAETMTLRL